MKQQRNRIGRNYGQFVWKELTYDERERQKTVPHTINVYKWQDGALTFELDERTVFVLPAGSVKDLQRLKDVDGN